jgi:hypothetical protein
MSLGRIYGLKLPVVISQVVSSLPIGCSKVIVFQEGAYCIEEVGSREDLCGMEEVVGQADIGMLPPLNTYSPTFGDLSGYFDWVIQCANEIYLIVGISYVGHLVATVGPLNFS